MKLILCTFSVLVMAIACTPSPRHSGDLNVGLDSTQVKDFFNKVDIVNSKSPDVELYLRDIKNRLITLSLESVSSDSCKDFKSISVEQLNFLSEEMNSPEQYRVRNYYFRCHADEVEVATNQKTGVKL